MAITKAKLDAMVKRGEITRAEANRRLQQSRQSKAGASTAGPSQPPAPRSKKQGGSAGLRKEVSLGSFEWRPSSHVETAKDGTTRPSVQRLRGTHTVAGASVPRAVLDGFEWRLEGVFIRVTKSLTTSSAAFEVRVSLTNTATAKWEQMVTSVPGVKVVRGDEKGRELKIPLSFRKGDSRTEDGDPLYATTFAEVACDDSSFVMSTETVGVYSYVESKANKVL